MKLIGKPFQNSSSCEGDAFNAPGANHDMSIIRITGRYPEFGWARNKKAYEIAYVISGNGSVYIKGEDSIAISQGEVVSIAPGKLFAWDGDIQIIMSCNPVFNSDQYEIVKEKNDER